MAASSSSSRLSFSHSPHPTSPPPPGRSGLQSGFISTSPITPAMRCVSNQLLKYLAIALTEDPSARRGKRLYGVTPHQYVRNKYQMTYAKLNDVFRNGNLFFILDGTHQYIRFVNSKHEAYFSEHAHSFHAALEHIGQKYEAHRKEFSSILSEAAVCTKSLSQRRSIQLRVQVETFRRLARQIEGLVQVVAQDMETIQSKIRSTFPLTQILETQDPFKLSFPLTVPHLFGGEALEISREEFNHTIHFLGLFYEGCSRINRAVDESYQKMERRLSPLSLESSGSHRAHSVDESYQNLKRHFSALCLESSGSFCAYPESTQGLFENGGYLDLIEAQSYYQQRWLMTLRQVQNLLLSAASILEFEEMPDRASNELSELARKFNAELSQLSQVGAFDQIVSAFKKSGDLYHAQANSLEKSTRNFLTPNYQELLRSGARGQVISQREIEEFNESRKQMHQQLNVMTSPCLPGKRLEYAKSAFGVLSRIQKITEKLRLSVKDRLEQTIVSRDAVVKVRDQLNEGLTTKLPRKIRFPSLFKHAQPLILDHRSTPNYRQNFQVCADFFQAYATSFESTVNYLTEFQGKLDRFYQFAINIKPAILREYERLGRSPDMDDLMNTHPNEYAP